MAQASPPLSRPQLERILGLESDHSNAELMRISLRLLTRLERRREHARGEERIALEQEIADLTTSLVVWARSGSLAGRGVEGEAGRPSTAATAQLSSSIARERLFIGVIALLVALVVGFIAAWYSENSRRSSGTDSRLALEPAQLIVESRPRNGELRIRRPESEELLIKIPAGGAYVDLDPGRYAIEVSREDCPDSWELEIELEAAETRRYEPTICNGTGELVVRSNVSGDRLRIDELDLGQTRAEPHLLGVGDHRIRIDKKGYLPFEGKVRIAPGETRELRAELVAKQAGAKAAARSNVPLPFDVVAPTQPPGVPGGGAEVLRAAAASKRSEKARTGGRQAFLPKPLVSDPIEIEPLQVKRPALDFDQLSTFQGLPKGGSTTWHDGVSSRVLRRFDADASGLIDRVSETQAIPCPFWKSIERSFDEGRLGLSMSRLYGFDGSEWHPKALGFAREQRSLAYERMKACGLAP